MSFDGENDYITTEDVSFTGSTDFSIFGWIRTSASGERRNIINIGGTTTSSASELYLYVTDNGKIKFDLRNIGGPISSSSVNTEEWVFVGVTYSSQIASIYVNSNLEQTSTFFYSANIEDGEQIFGASDSNQTTGIPSGFYEGSLDEVRIFNRVLTQTEINSLYNSNSDITSGLLGRWKFDDGNGTILTDSSSSGNDGTIHGATWISTGRW